MRLVMVTPSAARQGLILVIEIQIGGTDKTHARHITNQRQKRDIRPHRYNERLVVIGLVGRPIVGINALPRDKRGVIKHSGIIGQQHRGAICDIDADRTVVMVA